MSLKRKLKKLESYVQQKRLEKCVKEKKPEYIFEVLKNNRENSLKPGTYRAWHELIEAPGEIGDQKAIDPIISEIYFLSSNHAGGGTIATALKKSAETHHPGWWEYTKYNTSVHQR